MDTINHFGGCFLFTKRSIMALLPFMLPALSIVLLTYFLLKNHVLSKHINTQPIRTSTSTKWTILIKNTVLQMVIKTGKIT